MHSLVRMLVAAAAALCAAAQDAPAPDLNGWWIDSQGNRIQITQKAGRVDLTSTAWSFQTAEGAVRADLHLVGRITGVDLRLAQEDVTLNGRVVRGRVRATLQGAALAGPVDLILAPPPAARSRTTSPSRILLRVLQESTRPGKWVPVEIGVADDDGVPATPDRDMLVELTAAGGRPIPATVRVGPTQPAVPAGVILEGTGATTVTAKAKGLPPVRAELLGCAEGAIERIQMASFGSRARANLRDAIRFKVAFLDSAGNRVTNGKPKFVAWNLEGVGQLSVQPDRHGRSQEDAISADECVAANELRSAEAGKAVVVAKAFNASDTRTFYFIAPLSAAVFLMVALGAIGGAFVSAMRQYNTARRWAPRRWAVWLACGIFGGLIVFLAYHYGVLQALPQAPSGYGFAFFAGLVGGFLGAAALARIADLVLPDAHAAKSGA